MTRAAMKEDAAYRAFRAALDKHLDRVHEGPRYTSEELRSVLSECDRLRAEYIRASDAYYAEAAST